MASIHDMTRAENIMTADEHADLLRRGWKLEIVDSLRARGFREAGVDPDDRSTPMFLRQTSLPHIHIPICIGDTLEDIDTAIYDAGHRAGHEGLAGHFMRFFDCCKTWRGIDPLQKQINDLERRLAKFENPKPET